MPRLKLDPDQPAGGQRIDEESVDVEVAWRKSARAEQAVVGCGSRGGRCDRPAPLGAARRQ